MSGYQTLVRLKCCASILKLNMDQIEPNTLNKRAWQLHFSISCSKAQKAQSWGVEKWEGTVSEGNKSRQNTDLKGGNAYQKPLIW